jgi:hypothetical protein
MTCLIVLTLAAGKARTGRALDNPVLQTEAFCGLREGRHALHEA